jgi:hypothetical protein
VLAALALVAVSTAGTAGADSGQAQAAAAAKQWWKTSGAKLLAGFRNGQCTDWASRQRPDIVERVMEASLEAKLLRRPFPKVDFVAKNWASLAQLAGLTVRATPVKGAIAVWQPHVQGAKGSGHVGYVDSVGNGTFTVTEENFGKPYKMTSRTLAAAPLAGRVFIYP